MLRFALLALVLSAPFASALGPSVREDGCVRSLTRACAEVGPSASCEEGPICVALATSGRASCHGGTLCAALDREDGVAVYVANSFASAELGRETAVCTSGDCGDWD